MKFRILCIMVLFCFLATNIAASDDAQRVDITVENSLYHRFPLSNSDLAKQFFELVKIYKMMRGVMKKYTPKEEPVNGYWGCNHISSEESNPVRGSLTMGRGFMFEVTDTENVIRSFWGQAVVVFNYNSYEDVFSDYDKGIIEDLGLKELSSHKRPDFLYSGKKYLITSLCGKKVTEPVVDEVPLTGLYTTEHRFSHYEELRKNYVKLKEKKRSNLLNQAKENVLKSDECKHTKPAKK